MVPVVPSLLARLREAAHAVVLAASIAIVPAHAGGPVAPPTADAGAADRFIVKLRDPAVDARERLPAIGVRAGRSFTYVRAMSGGAHVVRLTSGLQSAATVGRTPAETNRLIAQQLMLDADVAYAEPDRRLHPLLMPNDTLYPQQWNYFEAAGGINLPAAWDITTGSTSIVTAVIDTGLRPHVDLAGRTVPGYDFIIDTTVSNDGNGRDDDPTDPGDFGCGTNSSWHGTHVAGTIGAASNNGNGVTGVNWVSKILPVRVLGVCGGYTSDIVDAMRWAAGIAVLNVPANANPARVQNLSLGDTSPCSNAFQSAIDDVVARGTVVVVAAGNENIDAANTQPAGCNNVITVGATTRNGGRAGFSNYGARVTLSAPGAGVLSTLNTGTTTPGSDSYQFYSGTSMATPHVAGVVSLMLSQNPALTPAQVKARLQSTARTFPTGTGADCTTAVCGAGIVNAAAALAPAAPAPARVNFAAQANGGVASASSTYYAGWDASGVNNGDRRGREWGRGGGWNDGTGSSFPDWIRIDLAGARSLTEIDVVTLQDDYPNAVEPDDATTFSQYGITAFDVQYWNGSAWVTVPSGSVVGNNRVVKRITFPAITTSAIRVQVNAALAGFSRIVEIEAYGTAVPVNVARPFNGGTASASSVYGAGFPASGTIDGDRRGLRWEAGGGWNDGTGGAFPDVLQVTFDAPKSIGEIDVFTLQDDYRNPQEPTEAMTFSTYGITDFDVQYWNGSAWITVPNGSVNGNNRVWRKFTFPAISTTAVRLYVRGALGSYARVTEIEAYVAP